jgi:thyrotropin receptor
LTEAHLTHSFHCCAFKFPAQHDPLRHELFIKVIDEFKKDCKDKGVLQVGGAKKLKRSNNVKNLSKSKVSKPPYYYDDMDVMDEDIFGGTFHEPIDVDEQSYEVEAMCGNITLQ